MKINNVIYDININKKVIIIQFHLNLILVLKFSMKKKYFQNIYYHYIQQIKFNSKNHAKRIRYHILLYFT